MLKEEKTQEVAKVILAPVAHLPGIKPFEGLMHYLERMGKEEEDAICRNRDE